MVRLWEEDPESYLTAGVNLVPLVPLTKVVETEEALRGLKARMAERINAEPKPRADKLWTATYFLMGIVTRTSWCLDSWKGCRTCENRRLTRPS